jgi:hypothetical protein
MNFVDFILLAAILAAAVSIIVFMRRRKKKGKACDSCGGCEGCPMAGTCADKGKQKSGGKA